MSLHFERLGSGRPLLMVHGLGANLRTWDPVLGALRGARELILVDLPGHGRSAPLAGPQTVEAYADALARFVATISFARVEATRRPTINVGLMYLIIDKKIFLNIMGNMPAAAPAIHTPDRALLTRLGQQLRRVRQQQKVGTVGAAEAAGISRVTLHRIEKGEPSVAMGAWVALASALGIELALVDPKTGRHDEELPAHIRLNDYPQLKALAWQLEAVNELTPLEALQIYERNWRHLDALALSQAELALIRTLTRTIGGGRLLV